MYERMKHYDERKSMKILEFADKPCVITFHSVSTFICVFRHSLYKVFIGNSIAEQSL